MPVTLAQAKLWAADAIDRNVIDEFRKSSTLLDAMPFDDVVNPAGGGATLTYGYTRQVTQPTAGFRAINTEYTPQEATKQQFTVDLKPLGGSFQIDRVLAGIAAAKEVAFQMAQKIKATRAKFHEAVIIGDTAIDANGFDGLNKALAGSTTELNASGPARDWTPTTEDAAFALMDDIDLLLGTLDGPASFILANKKGLSKIRSAARRAGYWTRERNELGVAVERYGDAILLDVGEVAGSSNLILPLRAGAEVQRVTLNGGPTGGTFTLTFDGQTTAGIAFNAAAAAVQSALEALSNLDPGDIVASGGPLPGAFVDVTFSGTRFTGVNVPLMTINTAGLTGGTGGTVTTQTAGGTGTAASGVFDLYAVRLGLDGFHGVAVAGQPLVSQWPPDFSVAGAVKTGEVELGPAAVALKATKAAAVYRNIRV